MLAVAQAQGGKAEAPGGIRVARGCPSGQHGRELSQALPRVPLPAQIPGGPGAPAPSSPGLGHPLGRRPAPHPGTSGTGRAQGVVKVGDRSDTPPTHRTHRTLRHRGLHPIGRFIPP